MRVLKLVLGAAPIQTDRTNGSAALGRKMERTVDGGRWTGREFSDSVYAAGVAWQGRAGLAIKGPYAPRSADDK